MARTKEFDVDKALNDALGVFWQKGYEATSIQDLVNATGVNRASLYETFGNKHSLFLQALDRFSNTQSPELAAQASPPGLPRIRAALELAAKQAASDQRGCLVVNAIVERATEDPALSELAGSARANLDNFFAAALADAVRLGQLPKGRNLLALARFLTNTLFGLRVTAKTKPSPDALRSIVDTALTILENR